MEELVLRVREGYFDIVSKVPARASRHRQKVGFLRVLRAGRPRTQNTQDVTVNVGAGALGDVTRVVGMLRLDVFLDA